LYLAHRRKEQKITFPLEKTAVIVAAGPSLDASVQKIITNRSQFYVIATDTALGVLQKNTIVPDACVSIDGQWVSCEHFMQDFSSKMLCVVDLCANPAFTQKAIKSHCPLIFCTNAHPLCQLICDFYSEKSPNTFFPLDSSAGTVTLAALNFARSVGFEKIETLGADFAYSNGKPYARGTYLDTLFSIAATRLKNTETQFVHLMYRTELFTHKKGVTTKVLMQYEQKYTDFMQKNEKKRHLSKEILQSLHFFSDFIVWYKEKLSKSVEKMDKKILYSVLPYACWSNCKQKEPKEVFLFENICRTIYDCLDFFGEMHEK
ncbi:MAG: 6-hydroxymethylpterin diphosphokinase MptE-like protein, partial [Treponemataceae bacterium]